MSLLVLKNFRIVDETTDTTGSVIVENGIIKEVSAGSDSKEVEHAAYHADTVINGGSTEQKHGLTLMPAFVDLHAHFREPGFEEKESRFSTKNLILSENRFLSENLESACLAAAAGGYGTVVCMANTKPVTDTIAQARSLKNRSDVLGIIDLYPALSLTKGMEEKELSEITLLTGTCRPNDQIVRLFSEDGKDLADDMLFLAAMAEARRTEIPISCHCDLGEENNAVKRVVDLWKKAHCPLHIAHVSTKEAAATIRDAKNNIQVPSTFISCEVTPHHIALTEKDSAVMGAETHGRVNPPLRTEEDRQALITAIADGTVDAIATDHAPHTRTDKEKGAPGFAGLETAFGVCYSSLVIPGHITLSKLSSLMSAAPARILGLGNCSGYYRGRIAPGLRADFAVADLSVAWTVDSGAFKSRGKNSPFIGRELGGRIVLTIRGGRVVFDRTHPLPVPVT
ncbi:MAG: dihydroorotase [Treponema sp.]|jgi:dihydroorotase|nr:dihydroorotase [Treponema sp.]